ncbi:LPS assembly lipoprotein LptE [uncultured Microscilla sp.]|uniref:LPS assembly lipoprotein LptE n=1 Tax=uncultured Microscilla sp. TaxID=432653 RepID=UPI002619EF6F|nr:LPS assembly lipoprotein LptE [uncultured Microscilla sp.]
MKLRNRSKRPLTLKSLWHYFSIYTLAIMVSTSLLSGCSFKYSFSGASIPPEVKTLFIANFQNDALGPANLGQDFTDRLKEYYQQNSSLDIVDRNGDWSISGSVTNYSVAPIALTAQSAAASNRLTIAINVVFESKKDETKNFTQSFSQFADFPQNQTLSQVETEKINEIFEKLLLDIFNRTAANW